MKEKNIHNSCSMIIVYIPLHKKVRRIQTSVWLKHQALCLCMSCFHLSIRTTCVNAHVAVCDCPRDGCCYLLLSHKHTWRAYLTPVDCFCNVCDWPASPQNVIRGDSMLDYNHTSLTWHIMTLPATAPPLSTAGHKLLSNGPRDCRRLRHEEKLDRSDKHGRPGGWQGVPAKIHLFLCLTLSHTLLPLSSPPHLSLPLFLPVSGRSPPVKTCVRELNSVCTSAVALTDQRQDPCFNLSCYTEPCVFQHFSCLQCWLLCQWSTGETSRVNLIKLSGSSSLVWWLLIHWGVRRWLLHFFLLKRQKTKVSPQ